MTADRGPTTASQPRRIGDGRPHLHVVETPVHPRFVDAAPVTDDVVTVVVPARNEEAFIGPCLDSILAQTERHLQVIVVDAASSDRTTEIVRAYAAADERVELLHNAAMIVPVALNIALHAARGRYLVRVDAHATVPPDYVERAVSHLRSGALGAVGGRKDGVGRTPAGRAVAAVMASRFGVGNSTYHHGTERRLVEHVPFGAYPTQLARALGGWNEDLPVNQDFEFDHRVRSNGFPILFDPALRIDWHCRQTIRDLYRQYRRYGWGKARVALLHPGSVRPRHLAAPALVAGYVVAPLLAFVSPWLAAPLLAYPVALAAATAVTAKDVRGTDARLLVAPAFVAMHVGWGIGFWVGLVDNLLRRRR